MSPQEEFPELDDRTVEAKLVEVLESYPLYRPFKFTNSSVKSLPSIIRINCQECCGVQNFERVETEGVTRETVRVAHMSEMVGSHRNSYTRSLYVCRNCRRTIAGFFVYWYLVKNGSIFVKCGQYPPLETAIDPLLRKALGEKDALLLEKAQRCRNFNFGLGCVGYLRRVVEDKMNLLLDLLEKEKQKEWTKEQEKEFLDAKNSWQFSEKLTYAATLLPMHLKPGGQNPLGTR